MSRVASLRPKVLLVGNFLSRHRSTKTVGEELAERLAGAGWDVTTTSSRPVRLGRLLDMQATIWRGGPWDVAQIDVYSGAAFRWAEAAAWSLRRLKVPYVATLHGGQLPEFAARRPRRVRRFLERAAAVTAPSAYLRDALAHLRDDILLLPNALDLAAYSREPAEPLRPDRPPCLRPRLVWLRALHRVYRPELAVEILARLKESHPDAELFLVGPDKGDGSLELTRRRMEELGVAERVHLVGGVTKDEVPDYLARGDIFLNTSDVDNAPVTVTEAMASGLAVVTTDAGGVGYLVDAGETALVVRRGDAEALTRAVRLLLDEPALAARLTTNARRAVEERDWGRVLPRWEALLAEHARSSGPGITR